MVPIICGNSGDPGLVGRNFVVAVLDEANQATEPESLVALLRTVESAVVVGDNQQLQPTHSHLQAAKLGLYVPMHERLQALGMKPLLFDTQYRMDPFIAEFPLSKFYMGKVTTGIAADGKPAVKGVPWLDPQVLV